MEWRTVNQSNTMWELTDDDGEQVAVAFKRTSDPIYSFVTPDHVNFKDFDTEAEAKEAAIVAVVTARIES